MLWDVNDSFLKLIFYEIFNYLYLLMHFTYIYLNIFEMNEIYTEIYVLTI